MKMLHEEQQYKKPEEELKSLLSETAERKGKQLCCPDCDTPVPAGHIHLEGAVAKCGECNTVFPIGKELEALKSEVLPEQVDEIEVVESEGQLDIKCNLRLASKNMAGPIVGGIYLAIAFIILIAMVVQGTPFFATSLVGLMASVVSIIFMNAVALYSNRTYISINKHQMSVERRPMKPLFARNDSYIDTYRIESVEIKKHFSSFEAKITYYDLYVKQKNGQTTRVIKKMMLEEQAVFLKKKINRYLSKLSDESELL